MDCCLPGSSVHGILQSRIPEWAAIPSSRGSSPPRDWTCISCRSCIAGGFSTMEPLGCSLRTSTRCEKKTNKLKRWKKKGQMALLPSINSTNLLPHAARHSTNAPKRKWLPLRNYKVHFLKIQAKKTKKVIYCVRSPQDSPTLKDLSMAKIYLQWHPKVTQLDPFSFHNWKRSNMCTRFLLEGAHWKPSIQSFIGGDERNGYHAPSHCMVGKSLRLQGGQQVSSINHTVHTNQWGTPNCAYWMGKGGFNPKSRSPDAGRPSER